MLLGVAMTPPRSSDLTDADVIRIALVCNEAVDAYRLAFYHGGLDESIAAKHALIRAIADALRAVRAPQGEGQQARQRGQVEAPQPKESKVPAMPNEPHGGLPAAAPLDAEGRRLLEEACWFPVLAVSGRTDWRECSQCAATAPWDSEVDDRQHEPDCPVRAYLAEGERECVEGQAGPRATNQETVERVPESTGGQSVLSAEGEARHKRLIQEAREFGREFRGCDEAWIAECVARHTIKALSRSAKEER